MLTIASIVFLLSAVSAYAEKSAADTYLSLKKSSGAVQISPTELRNNLTSYIGKTVELRGIVNGKASSEASVSFMIYCGDDNCPHIIGQSASGMHNGWRQSSSSCIGSLGGKHRQLQTFCGLLRI